MADDNAPDLTTPVKENTIEERAISDTHAQVKEDTMAKKDDPEASAQVAEDGSREPDIGVGRVRNEEDSKIEKLQIDYQKLQSMLAERDYQIE